MIAMVAERQIFTAAGQSVQTIDLFRSEYSIGMRESSDRTYDRLALQFQEERLLSESGELRRETYGIAYYAVF